MTPSQLNSYEACANIAHDSSSHPLSSRSLLGITSSETPTTITLLSVIQDSNTLQYQNRPRNNSVTSKTANRQSLLKILSEALALIEDDVNGCAERH